LLKLFFDNCDFSLRSPRLNSGTAHLSAISI
jgi:hypothetical protein